jgi:hypothetical protein
LDQRRVLIGFLPPNSRVIDDSALAEGRVRFDALSLARYAASLRRRTDCLLNANSATLATGYGGGERLAPSIGRGAGAAFHDGRPIDSITDPIVDEHLRHSRWNLELLIGGQCVPGYLDSRRQPKVLADPLSGARVYRTGGRADFCLTVKSSSWAALMTRSK